MKSNLGDLGFIWLSTLDHSPLLQGSQGRNTGTTSSIKRNQQGILLCLLAAIQWSSSPLLESQAADRWWSLEKGSVKSATFQLGGGNDIKSLIYFSWNYALCILQRPSACLNSFIYWCVRCTCQRLTCGSWFPTITFTMWVRRPNSDG